MAMAKVAWVGMSGDVLYPNAILALPETELIFSSALKGNR
jgi:hypothetical protein